MKSKDMKVGTAYACKIGYGGYRKGTVLDAKLDYCRDVAGRAVVTATGRYYRSRQESRYSGRGRSACVLIEVEPVKRGFAEDHRFQALRPQDVVMPWEDWETIERDRNREASEAKEERRQRDEKREHFVSTQGERLVALGIELDADDGYRIDRHGHIRLKPRGLRRLIDLAVGY